MNHKKITYGKVYSPPEHGLSENLKKVAAADHSWHIITSRAPGGKSPQLCDFFSAMAFWSELLGVEIHRRLLSFSLRRCSEGLFPLLQ